MTGLPPLIDSCVAGLRDESFREVAVPQAEPAELDDAAPLSDRIAVAEPAISLPGAVLGVTSVATCGQLMPGILGIPSELTFDPPRRTRFAWIQIATCEGIPGGCRPVKSAGGWYITPVDCCEGEQLCC